LDLPDGTNRWASGDREEGEEEHDSRAEGAVGAVAAGDWAVVGCRAGGGSSAWEVEMEAIRIGKVVFMHVVF
jgi:hypothetical protein